jgi:alpha-galactosidase
MCALNESLFVETADAMVDKGLLAAGYDRINLDDCWLQHERADNGSLQWNTTLFPKGLIWLGEYVKSKGFFYGIYEDAGNATCGGYPGTRGHEELDAKTFESWGFNYLKLDGMETLHSASQTSANSFARLSVGCNMFPPTEQTYQDVYGHWHEILTSLEHPLVFSESAPAYFSATNNNTDWYEVMDWVPL